MPTIQIETEQLVNAALQLPPLEQDRLIARLQELRRQPRAVFNCVCGTIWQIVPRSKAICLKQPVHAFAIRSNAPRLSPQESELLRQVNQGPSAELQHRFAVLHKKRRRAKLSRLERQELLALTR